MTQAWLPHSLFLVLFIVSPSICAYPTSTSIHKSGVNIRYGLTYIKHLRSASHKPFYVQAGVFKSIKNAQNLKRQLSSQYHYPVIIEADDNYYFVFVGPNQAMDTVKQHHHSSINYSKPTTSLLLTSTLPKTASVTRISPKSWSRVLSLSAGPSLSNPTGQTQNIFLQPDFQQAFVAHQTSNTLASGELFLGLQQIINPSLAAQLGIAVAGSSNATLEGEIWEDADPDFSDFTYHYQINHWHLALKTKLLTAKEYGGMQPYLSASIGLAFNRAQNFTAMPILFEQIPAPGFVDHTQSAFTYTAGAGLQTSLRAGWKAGFGYEFADWGKSTLGSAPQSLPLGIQLNHLYTHQAQLSLNYIS